MVIHKQERKSYNKPQPEILKQSNAIDICEMNKMDAPKCAKCSKCGTVITCTKGDCDIMQCPKCGWDVYF